MCLARCYGDMMSCSACGLSWDTNDPEPPACRKVDRRTKLFKAAQVVEVEPATVDRHTLPDVVAQVMIRAYDAAGGGVVGMRAAHRVFLDMEGI